MSAHIPTHPLSILSPAGEAEPELLLVNQRLEMPAAVIGAPYRSNYYGIGVCLAGTAALRSNLETYTVAAGWMITMPPHALKQWLHRSDDFHTLTVFFTKAFMRTAGLDVDKFLFFDNVARHAFPVSPAQLREVEATLLFLHRKDAAPPAYRVEILQRLIHVLLCETSAVYEQHRQAASGQTRAQGLAAEFKKLVNRHCGAERALKFYAHKLCITANHLSETVKEVTGKTAGEWLTEAVVLEAKVLLQNPALSIAQVANGLHFADQSTFGKFFKQATGLSPRAYRQPSQTGDSVFLTNNAR